MISENRFLWLSVHRPNFCLTGLENSKYKLLVLASYKNLKLVFASWKFFRHARRKVLPKRLLIKISKKHMKKLLTVITGLSFTDLRRSEVTQKIRTYFHNTYFHVWASSLGSSSLSRNEKKNTQEVGFFLKKLNQCFRVNVFFARWNKK